MLAHFKKLQASIHAIERYLTIEQQSSRFLQLGWPNLEIVRNLWDLWSDDDFTPPTVRRQLDAIEPFDEWEEFALFGSHYFLLAASNAELKSSTETRGPDAATIPHDAEIGHTETINLTHYEDPASDSITPRRFTSAFRLDADEVAIHGGQGQQSRLSQMEVLRRNDSSGTLQPYASQGPAARMCHTITSLGQQGSLLVGGRGSPSQALKDCWLCQDGIWTEVDSLRAPRYRHSAVGVDLDCDTPRGSGVLAFGGKTNDGTVLADWSLWTANTGWSTLR